MYSCMMFMTSKANLDRSSKNFVTRWTDRSWKYFIPCHVNVFPMHKLFPSVFPLCWLLYDQHTEVSHKVLASLKRSRISSKSSHLHSNTFGYPRHRSCFLTISLMLMIISLVRHTSGIFAIFETSRGLNVTTVLVCSSFFAVSMAWAMSYLETYVWGLSLDNIEYSIQLWGFLHFIGGRLFVVYIMDDLIPQLSGCHSSMSVTRVRIPWSSTKKKIGWRHSLLLSTPPSLLLHS